MSVDQIIADLRGMARVLSIATALHLPIPGIGTFAEASDFLAGLADDRERVESAFEAVGTISDFGKRAVQMLKDAGHYAAHSYFTTSTHAE